MGWTDVFADFAATTDDTYFDSPEKLINQATERSPLLGKFLKSSGTAKVIKGGERMRFQTFFDEVNTAVDYGGPNPTLSISNPQIVTEGVADWRFSADHMAWTDHEIGLQVNTSMTREARYRRIRDLYAVKEQRLATSIIKHMENQLFAAPLENMEGTSGSVPMSIPFFITENTGTTAGAAPTFLAADVDGRGTYPVIEANDTSGAKVEDLTPTGEWTNQISTYTKPTSYASDIAAGELFNAFDRMIHNVQYQPLPMYEGQSEPLNSPNFIVTSKQGRIQYMKALRDANDQLLGASSRQDPSYMNPLYSGIPMIYASVLDSAAIYADGGTGGLQTEGDTADAGPRFYFIDTDVLCKVFHDERYFSRKQPQPHPNQPFSHVMWVDCWHQLICTERRKLGIVSPS